MAESKALVGVLASCSPSPLNHCFQARLTFSAVCTGKGTGTGESQSPDTSFLRGVVWLVLLFHASVSQVIPVWFNKLPWKAFELQCCANSIDRS